MFSQYVLRCLLCSSLVAALGAARIVDGNGASDIAANIEQLRTALQDVPRAQNQVTSMQVIAVVEELVLPHIDVALAGQK